MVDRIYMRAGIVGDNLLTLMGRMDEMQKLLVTFNESQLAVAKQATMSTYDLLQEVLASIQPKEPGQSLFLTYDDLSNIENRARNASEILASAQATLRSVISDSQSPVSSTPLTGIMASLNTAAEIAKRMPEAIFNISSGGQSSLSFAALNSLRQELQLSLVTNQGGGIRVVDTATVSAPSSGIFGRYMNVVLAVVAALLLCILGLLLLQYFDPTIRDISQVTVYLGLPMLANVITVRNNGKGLPSILDEKNKALKESFRILRTNLRLDSSPGKVLLVTSPQEKEGKTVVAANLARAVALQGNRVLLIDGDVVSLKPGIQQTFSLLPTGSSIEPAMSEDISANDESEKFGSYQTTNLQPTSGLADLITHDEGLWAYASRQDGVDIISLGKVSSSSEIASSPKMKEFISNARKLYDALIIDGSPILGNANARILAKQADEVLLVLRNNSSRLDLARDSAGALQSIGARVVGYVLIG